MISLPSPTYVGRKLPKEDFYRRLKLTSKQRDSFVSEIETITIANSLKPSTMRITDGEEIHEIFVIDLALKQSCVPITVTEAIAKENPHKILFRSLHGDEEHYSVHRLGKEWHTDWTPIDSETISIQGESLDEIWDSLCAQIAFGDAGIKDVDNEIRKRQKVKGLDEEIAKLERAHGKEKQLGKRNALFQKLQAAKRERDEILKG